ncbi:hypothetical protein AURDEDRAFT_143291, partial [Auricularia subglabra TFB-10046 SS5]
MPWRADQQLARRQGLERDLNKHRERHALLQDRARRAAGARQEALAALEVAQAAFSAADALRDSLEARCIDAQKNCDDIQRLLAFDPDIVNGLPVELLQVIFVELCRSVGGVWQDIEDAQFSQERAATPYRLAAVCRRWRNVALVAHELWCYVGIPSIRRSRHDLLADYIQCLLDRSGSRPLDLLLAFREPREEDCAVFTEIARVASAHAHRWRRVTIKFPPQMDARHFEELLLNCGTPLLEVLHIASAFPFAQLPTGRHLRTQWLSDASSLRAISVRDAIFCPSVVLHTVLRATLHISRDEELRALYDALRHLPAITTL